jgi:DNA replication and repair protein RecF
MFWLKLAEVRYIEQATKKRPLLLLDDVFSELDAQNKKMVMEFLPDYQTILTTTEDELLDIEGIDKEVIRL